MGKERGGCSTSFPPYLHFPDLFGGLLKERFCEFTTSATWGKNVSLCVAFSVIALWASLVAQTIKNPPMRETRVQSLGWEDPWEEERATHSIILAWKIPQTEEPGGLQSLQLERAGHD